MKYLFALALAVACCSFFVQSSPLDRIGTDLSRDDLKNLELDLEKILEILAEADIQFPPRVKQLTNKREKLL